VNDPAASHAHKTGRASGQVRQKTQVQREQGGKMRANILTLVLIVVAAVLFLQRALALPPTPLRIAGLAIVIPSFVLFLVARMQLGDAFSLQARASQLVTTGLYARIRNPIYVFGALMVAGAIVWSQHLVWLLVFAVLIPMQILRSRKEAQVLEAKFGTAYLEYKQKTWF
jgi:protein-S-isoprenylcysteine O-methyltransferase Ste14